MQDLFVEPRLPHRVLSQSSPPKRLLTQWKQFKQKFNKLYRKPNLCQLVSHLLEPWDLRLSSDLLSPSHVSLLISSDPRLQGRDPLHFEVPIGFNQNCYVPSGFCWIWMANKSYRRNLFTSDSPLNLSPFLCLSTHLPTEIPRRIPALKSPLKLVWFLQPNECKGFQKTFGIQWRSWSNPFTIRFSGAGKNLKVFTVRVHVFQQDIASRNPLQICSRHGEQSVMTSYASRNTRIKLFCRFGGPISFVPICSHSVWRKHKKLINTCSLSMRSAPCNMTCYTALHALGTTLDTPNPMISWFYTASAREIDHLGINYGL